MSHLHHPLRPGADLAGYRVDECIGQGGMSVVYGATDLRLRRRVALKVLLPELDPVLLGDEGAALAALDGRGVPSVFAFHDDACATALAMERLHGQTLGVQLLHRGAVSLEAALLVLEPLAETLQRVHGAGFAHRDVKPENVMLTTDRRVLLMDFGVACSTHDPRRVRAAGTRGYLAPEAWFEPIGGEAAQALDVFALGAVAHELLLGEVPGADEGPDFVLGKLCHGFPAHALPFYERSPAFADLVAAMLSPDPRARPDMADVYTGFRHIRSRTHRAPRAAASYAA